MPTLAPPPVPPVSTRPQLELPPVSFFGRSLTEYAQFFALEPTALRGRDVLDVAAGPASFVAEACARKINAIAVDPLYGNAPDALAAYVQRDYDRMFAHMRAKPHLFKVKLAGACDGNADASELRDDYFDSIDAAEADRRAAAQRFLADYAAHFVHNRYIGASLPRLPFFDGTFDLVLCAHLLFIYASRFDFDWHLAACRELVRVSAGDVRIHPVCGADGKPYPGIARLRRELRGAGIASAMVAVDYEFFGGGRSMLVLKRDTAKA